MLILIFFPYLFYVFLLRNKSKLNDQSFSDRFGAMYLNTNTDSYKTLAIIVFYMLRRFIFACSLVFLRDIPFAQFCLQILLSLCLIAYNMEYQPIEVRALARLETLNELCLYLDLCLCLDIALVKDKDHAELIGFLVISLTMATMLINWGYLFYCIGVHIFHAFRKCIRKAKIKKSAAKPFEIKGDLGTLQGK